VSHAQTLDALPSPSRRATFGEIAVVLGLPTLLFVSSSLTQLVLRGRVVFTDGRILSSLAIECVLATLLLPFLRRRGWTPKTATRTLEPRDSVRGVGVWLGAMLAYYIAYVALYMIMPEMAAGLRSPGEGGTVSLPVAVAATVINPVFEEFLWLAYAVPTVQSRLGLRAACVLSVSLRVAVHLYQGPMAIVGVLPAAVVFTLYFARTGRVWPVIVAHAIADGIGLIAIALAVK
jgi:membrane protease YdiL (CAAX protease family)